MNSLPKLVIEFRNRLGDSQPKFAARLGISSRAIANYDAGRRPTRAVLWKLAELAKHCEFDDLCTRFFNAYFTAMGGATKPIDRYETAWVRMILAIVRRHRSDGPEAIKKLSEHLVSMLEYLATGAVGCDAEDLRLTLTLARSEFSPTAEAHKRAEKISRDTGEAVEKVCMRVLLDDPKLYAEVRAERLREQS